MSDRHQAEALERELVRLPGVRAVRVVVDRSGHLAEIHVLSTTDFDPRKVVRDVQTVALSTFGVEIDRRVVSVARLADGPPAGMRPVVTDIEVEERGVQCAVTVTLELSGQRWVGTASGSNARSARLRTAGLAVLDALCRIVPAASVSDLATPVVVETAEREVVVVDVALGSTDERVCGSAVVRDAGEVDAVVRAVLDATNRRLATLASVH